MFVDEILEATKGYKFTKYHQNSSTYPFIYQYWVNKLFERVMRLFVWEGTEEVLPKEIEQRLILSGFTAVTKLPKEKELTAMFASFYGVTKYQDEFTNCNVRCPIYSGSRTIGKDVAIINANSLRNPAYSLIHHYASLLAHNEVTIITTLVNARDCGGVPVAGTNKQKESIRQYQSDIFNGKFGVVTDIGNLGVEYVGSDRKTAQSITDLYSTREKILKSFYADIGIRGSFEKRSNSVEAEVEADTSLLLFDLDDMLETRKEGADMVNKIFGKNWTVKKAEVIDYSLDPEPEEEKGDVKDEEIDNK